jgi:hypothetical protein
MASKTQIINGSFQNNLGQPLNNGFLLLALSQDGTINSSPYHQIVGGTVTKVPLDNNGNVAGFVTIWTNDLIVPAGTFYTVQAYNNAGLQVWDAPQYWTLTSGSAIDLGSLAVTNP